MADNRTTVMSCHEIDGHDGTAVYSSTAGRYPGNQTVLRKRIESMSDIVIPNSPHLVGLEELKKRSEGS